MKKTKNIQFTEEGIEKMEQKLASQLKAPSLFDFENLDFLTVLSPYPTNDLILAFGIYRLFFLRKQVLVL